MEWVMNDTKNALKAFHFQGKSLNERCPRRTRRTDARTEHCSATITPQDNPISEFKTNSAAKGIALSATTKFFCAYFPLNMQ